MGTRSLIAVYMDGAYKVAQYNQWDGYLEGVGTEILHFLKTTNLDKFKANLSKCTFVDETRYKEMWKSIGVNVEENNGFVSMEESNKFAKKYPAMTRDIGAGLLQYIVNADEAEVIELNDNLSFAGDGLFCEYAYVIDFDKNVFEIYTGFHKGATDPDERFACFTNKDDEYRPVKLLKSYELDKLPYDEEFTSLRDEDE